MNHQHLYSLIDVHEWTKMVAYRTYTVLESRLLSGFSVIYPCDLLSKTFGTSYQLRYSFLGKPYLMFGTRTFSVLTC